MNYDAISTRDAFGLGLVALARENPDVYAVAADTTKSMGYAPMEREFPDRVFNVGICEQNMAMVAAGIASCGGVAFAATYAPFASMRMLEQIRTFAAYPGLDVKVVSGLAGMSGNIEGVTHQGIEDVSIMRAIPGMAVLVPADAVATEEMTRVMGRTPGPAYLRIGRGPVPKVFDEYSFTMGKANVMKADGDDLAVFANGVALARVLEAEKLLRDKGLGVRVIEVPCVKPLDVECIFHHVGAVRAVATVEENTILGGLGGAVAETLCDRLPKRLVRIGIDDVFTESAPHEDLLDRYNLAVADIARRLEAHARIA